MQRNNVSLKSSIFTNESSTCCSDIIEHKVGIPKLIIEPKTTTMYHTHTFVASTCTHVVHSGVGFRFGDGFRCNHHHYVSQTYMWTQQMYACGT